MSNSFGTPWTVACQAPLSMGFPRQEYWIGLPFPSPGHLPHQGMKPLFLALASGSLPLDYHEKNKNEFFFFFNWPWKIKKMLKNEKEKKKADSISILNIYKTLNKCVKT